MVHIPFQNDMGSIDPFVATSTPMESARENALWTFNRMRSHDGLPHRNKLPNGTRLERLEP